MLVAVIYASKTLDPPEEKGAESSISKRPAAKETSEALAKKKIMELLSKRERDIKNYWTSIENPDKPAVSGRRKRGKMDVEDSYDEARSKRQINKALFGHHQQAPQSDDAPRPYYQPIPASGINIL